MEELEAKKIVKKYHIDKEEIKRLARIRYINESVLLLKKFGFHYEAILFSSQVVEFTLRNLVEECEKIIEEVVRNKTVIKYENNLNLENKTLGQLIFLAEKNIKNKNLIRDLKEFLKIRNKIAHNLITSNQDIKEIEDDAGKYVKNGKIFNLFKSILDESTVIRYKQLEKDLKEKGLEMPQFIKDRLKVK